MINDLVERQHRFFKSGQSRDTDFRKKQLKKLKRLLGEHEEQFYDAMQADFHKPRFETYVTELFVLYQEIDHLIEYMDRWSKPKKVKSSLLNFPSSSSIYPQPYGVSLVIGAWNYPLQLTVNPALGALAAGNTVILKPSEISTHTSHLLGNIINNNFDSGYLHVVEGDAESTQKLMDQPLDYIFFTGSTRIGKIIMKSAAEQLTPVTLELGGKSPAIIDQTANISLAAKRIAWGKFINAGQTCVSPDYVYIHASKCDEFCEQLKNQIQTFYGDDPAKSPDYARIISDKHFKRLVDLIKQEKITHGGRTDAESRYIEPTVMTGASWQDPVMQQEIFGPILPILTYNSLDDVMETLQHKPKALALYLFSESKKIQEKVISRVSFGGGCINDTVAHLADLELPFGGVGNSGFGRYHGKYSFDTFSYKKSIMKKSTWLDIPLRYPPYKGKIKWLKKLMKFI